MHPVAASWSRSVLALAAGAFAAAVAAASPPAVPVLQPTAGAGVVEGDAGTRMLEVPVTLSAPAKSAVSVAYATADHTATAGVDYTATSGRLVIPAGQTRGVIRVPILGDRQREFDEVIDLKLSAPSGADLPDPFKLLPIIIYNDDDYAWGPAQPLVYPQFNIDFQRGIGVGLDDGGNATVVWQQVNTPASTQDYAGVASRRYLAGKGWQPATMIAQKAAVGGFEAPGLAVAGNGPALVAWGGVPQGVRSGTLDANGLINDVTMLYLHSDHTDVVASAYDPLLGWSATQVISAPGGTQDTGTYPVTAIGRSGRGVVAWGGGNPTFVAYDRQHGFGAPRALTDQGGRFLNVATDDAGNATFWWQASTVDRLRYGAALLARQLLADGTLGPVEPVSAGVTDRSGAGAPNLVATAMGRDGVAYAAWIAVDGNGGSAPLYVTRRNPGEAWQAPTLITQVGTSSSLAWDYQGPSLELVASASGALMSWTTDNTPYVTQYAMVSPGGAWSRPAGLLPDGTAIQPTLALADNGEALAIFAYTAPVPSDPYHFQLDSIRYKPGQGWSAREVVNTSFVYRAPNLAMSPDGRGMAVYTGNDNPSSTASPWYLGGTRFE